jgi:hypothetical protein
MAIIVGSNGWNSLFALCVYLFGGLNFFQLKQYAIFKTALYSLQE